MNIDLGYAKDLLSSRYSDINDSKAGKMGEKKRKRKKGSESDSSDEEIGFLEDKSK